MSKLKFVASGVLGFAFLCVGATPAFAATPTAQGVVQNIAPAQHGVINLAPVVAPAVAPVVAPVVKPQVIPVIAPTLVLAPDVHPTIVLPGSN
jgi:hypothetical protein